MECSVSCLPCGSTPLEHHETANRLFSGAFLLYQRVLAASVADPLALTMTYPWTRQKKREIVGPIKYEFMLYEVIYLIKSRLSKVPDDVVNGIKKLTKLQMNMHLH